MFIFVIVFLLLAGNWLLSNALVFIPLILMGKISSLSWLILGIFGLSFLGWCLGDR